MLTFIAEDAEILAHVDLDAAVARVEQSLRRAPFSFLLIFEAVLLFLEYGLPPFVWKFRRFSKCSLEKRLKVAKNFEHGAGLMKQNCYKLLKVITMAGMMTEPALLEWIGYGKSMAERQASKTWSPGELGEAP
jgi:hypothetical protein